MPSLKRIQDFVSLLFYKHGLLCATYPFVYIFGVITINLFMCYPLLKLPFPGNVPHQYLTPMEGYSVPSTHMILEGVTTDVGLNRPPRWYFGAPVAYVQQIVVKVAILPWDSNNLISSDLLRTSLWTVFDLLEHIDNYQLRNNMSRALSLADVCLRVSEVVSDEKVDDLLPEYNCLSVSPARFWKQDKQQFLADNDLIGTLFKKHGLIFNTPPSIRDILFGVPWVKKYHLQRRRRVISYAVTIAFREYNQEFLSGLREKLLTIYSHSSAANVSQSQQLVHIHYLGHNYIVEYTPLMFTYIVLCFYLYFSVRKIEMVKSKWGLALSAVVTIFASLLMSVSLCVFFGLIPSLSSSEIFPYLVIIIGLENVLVITKSVVTTPVHLDVKFRIALGLQKEGWSIFKNLTLELLVAVFGIFTFAPAIQEFCLFAVLGLGSDFFLQMFFFTAVLSVDIRRMELSDLQRPSMHEAIRFESFDFNYPGGEAVVKPSAIHSPVMSRIYPSGVQSGSNGSLRLPIQRLNVNAGPPQKSTPLPSPVSSLEMCDDLFYMDLDDERLPRRMRLIHFWARYRILQRGITFCVLIWIALIFFKTGLVEDFDQMDPTFLNKDLDLLNTNSLKNVMDQQKVRDNPSELFSIFMDSANTNKTAKEELNRSPLNLFLDNTEQWRQLSSNHWLTLMGYYNISLLGRYLTILPSIHLSIAVTPDVAISIRHPSQMIEELLPPQHTQTWDSSGQFTPEPNQSSSLIQRLVRYPRTKMEFVITILLGIASFVLLFFIVLFMYRCVCSRNYARWRSSWQKRRLRKANQYYKQIRESVPLVLNGHVQEVECLITDGQHIVSSCLGGEIRVWDIGSGECLVSIDRAKIVSRRSHSSWPSLPSESRHSSHSEGNDRQSSPLSESPPSSSVPSRAHKPRQSHNSLNLGSVGNDDVLTYVHNPDHDAKHHSRHKSVDCALASIIPDLTETIDTDFRNYVRNKSTDQDRLSTSGNSEKPCEPDSDGSSGQHRMLSNGYDFTHFESYFAEHRKMKQEEELHVLRKRGMKQRSNSHREEFVDEYHRRPEEDQDADLYASAADVSPLDGSSDIYVEVPSAIWCLACNENIIVAGCGNGAVEFWDTKTGALKYIYQQSKSGVTGVCLSNSRVIAARIDGTLDFLQYFNSSPLSGYGQSSAQHRSGLGADAKETLGDLCAHCALTVSIKAHQQPINLLSAKGRYVVTASHDHTLKVYRIEDSVCLYTLHGHTSGVTALYIDTTPLSVISGSVDASVRIWDIQMGTCVHILSGHTGTVTSITCSLTHVISIGMDDRLCIWDRSKGHLTHCVQLEPGYCNTVSLLTRHLIITGGQGSLHLWDVHKGSPVRALSLGTDHDASVFVRQLLVIDNSVVVCDFGPQLRVIQFTPVLEKDD